MTEPTTFQKLREPFPAAQIAKVKKEWTDKRTNERKSITLDYVNHAVVTERLLAVDPTYSFEPLTDINGVPLIVLQGVSAGDEVGVWGRLKILDTEIIEFCSGKDLLDAYSRCLCRAAMRRGVALDLWIKEAPTTASRTSTQPPTGRSTPTTSSQEAAVASSSAPPPPSGGGAQTLVEKAQAAQAEHKGASAPDTPKQLPNGKFECTTFISRVDGPNDKGWYQVFAPVSGGLTEFSTKLENIADAARGLEGTSCVVRWSEKTTTRNDRVYTNRYLDHVEQADMVPEIQSAINAAALDNDLAEIPF